MGNKENNRAVLKSIIIDDGIDMSTEEEKELCRKFDLISRETWLDLLKQYDKDRTEFKILNSIITQNFHATIVQMRFALRLHDEAIKKGHMSK